MRLYAPAKPSTSTGEDGRPLELTRRSIDNNDHRPDDKLQLNAPRIDDKTQPNHNSRLDDKIQHLNGPLRHEQTPPTTGVVVDLTTTTPTTAVSTKKASPPTTMTVSPHRNNSYNSTEINGIPTTATTTTNTTTSSTAATTQNGPNNVDYSSPVLENGTDSLRSLDSIPWNLEGTETIIENGSRSTTKNGPSMTEEDELKKLREENKRLKTALEEAAEVNGQWRQYHEERQGYVQRLLTTIHELQHAHSSTAPSPRQLDGEVGTGGGQEGEVRRLREAMTRLQADHHEHVQLLEMQVRAHRDDWEAERSEKRSAEAALAETEARAALLLQELQLLQAKLADSESKRGLCWRCLCPRTDYNNHRSGSNSAPRTPQASPIPAPGGGASPAPVVPSAPQPDNPPPPLKGWIPVSMLHQIAFSGATPEHQTPVVQSQSHQQQPSRNHAPIQTPQVSQNMQNQQQQQIHQPQPLPQQQQKPYQLSQQIQQQQPKQQHLQVQQQHITRQPQQIQHQKQAVAPCVTKPVSVASTNCVRGNDFMHVNNKTHENSMAKVSNIVGVTDDKKRYEAMGARPKILGNLQSISGKGVGMMEDEKSAKHRARSILASAIPVSPVSSGPSTPYGISVTKSSSSSSMPKGYVPITSTVLTPVNFRPPFVAHKRPSAMKHIVQVTKQTSPQQTPSSNVPNANHARSDSSPASLCSGSSTDVNKSQITCQTGNIVHDHQPGVLNKHSVCSSTQNYSNNTQSIAQTNEGQKSVTPGVKKVSANTLVDNDSRKEINTSAAMASRQKAPENTDSISVVTTTISCSSPPINTATASVSSNLNGSTTVLRTSHSSTFSQHPTTNTSGTTAFAAVTVTTTSAGNHTSSTSTTSSYSSTTSSRSSSPGISLTTFGLNSEGRGIPGAICFALGSDQKVARSSQPSRTSNSTLSPPPDSVTAGQSQKDVRPPSGVKSPTIIINCAPAPTTVKEEHWWSVESPGRNNKQQNNQSGKLVNSTWVRLMGGQANNRPGSGLPWRTARAVSGQHLIQTRRASNEETCSNGTTSPNSVCSSTATFNYTPAVNSPPSSNLSSATNSAPSSPPPNPNQPPCDDLRSMASKNITSAIMSYELNTKCEPIQTPSEVNATQSWSGRGGENTANDGVATMTRRDLVCPSCQMLFPPEKHLEFLDHFEVCRGPEYADL